MIGGFCWLFEDDQFTKTSAQDIAVQRLKTDS
jgi:hypothetical protein